MMVIKRNGQQLSARIMHSFGHEAIKHLEMNLLTIAGDNTCSLVQLSY